jgi:predicted RNase H-like nuclease (RuvC/YqgF family)
VVAFLLKFMNIPKVLRRNVKLIVGFDPGTTAGIACLDLGGNLIHMSSRKGLGISGATKLISGLGEPVLFACDVNPVPKTVKKIASSFNCSVFYPQEGLSVAEKKLIAKSENPADDHQRDALAAAKTAYECYEEKLKKAMYKAMKQGVDAEEAMAVVLRGEAVTKAIRKLKKGKEESTEGRESEVKMFTAPVKARIDLEIARKEIQDKEETIKRLRRYVNTLKRRIEELRKKPAGKTESQELVRQKRIARQVRKDFKAKLRAKEKELEWLEDSVRKVAEGKLIVIPAESFTRTRPVKGPMFTDSGKFRKEMLDRGEKCHLCEVVAAGDGYFIVNLNTRTGKNTTWLEGIVQEYRKRRT